MTTPESRTVEERLAAVLIDSDLIRRYDEYSRDAHPDTMRSTPQDELARSWATAILAAAKEHGLVIGEGELDRAWKEAEETLDSCGLRFAMLRRYGDTYEAWWIKEDGKLDGVEGQPTPTVALQELAAKLRESRR